MVNEELLKGLKARRSIRHYTSEQVADELLEKVLEAGTYAPTGHNTQEPWIVAVQDESICSRLRRMNAAVWGSEGDPYYGAPTIILVFADSQCRNAVQDGSLVLGNMMLAAYACGLGSCWINREREMFETEEGKELMRELGLPEGLVGVGALALGNPDRPLPSPRPRKEGYYRIIK